MTERGCDEPFETPAKKAAGPGSGGLHFELEKT